MPELPEVETVRRGLASHVIGRRIERVDIGRERSVRRVGREAVIAGFSGTSITRIDRRGKYLLGRLDSGDSFMIHLRMSGRLLLAPEGSPRPAHSHVVLRLADAGDGRHELRFVDPRTFGEVVVYDPDDADRILPELGRLGVDPVAEPFDARVLRERLAGRRGAIKPLLLNQHVVAGIGNIYADEILHRARIRWDRPVDGLSARTVRLLAECIVEVLCEAIEAGGSTLEDTQYVDVNGDAGWFQTRHLVYGREGQSCLTCGKVRIVRTLAAGRSTSYCPRCQR